jgi:hypothetical protein
VKIAKFLAFGVFCAYPISAYTQPPEQMKTMAVTGAQLSGGIARIAADICQIDQGRIDAYKERARRAYVADGNFGGNWIIGWRSQQQAIDDVLKLSAGSPEEYTQAIFETCAEMGHEIGP